MDSQTNIDSDLLDERRRKQEFLRQEILDKGYDTVKFSEYMCAIKAEGYNIDVWSFDELQTAVKGYKKVEGHLSLQGNAQLDESTVSFLQLFDRVNLDVTTRSFTNGEEQKFEHQDMMLTSFQKNFEESKIEPNDASFDQTQKIVGEGAIKDTTSKPNMSIDTSRVSPNQTILNPNSTSVSPVNTVSIKINNVATSFVAPIEPKSAGSSSSSSLNQTTLTKSPSLRKENSSRTVIETKVSEPTKLSQEKNPVITVQDPEQIKGGVFSGAFIQYTVKTEPLGWAVKRRYNDFFWLRDTLQKLYPGVFIPPIPSKKSKKKFEDDVVRKRMFFFETFLNACMEHEDLKADKYLNQFLYLLDENKFKKLKEEADKIPRPKKVEDVPSVKGTATLDSNPDLNKYMQLVDGYCTETAPIYKKIRRITKSIVVALKQVSTLSGDLGDAFELLNRLTSSFNKKVPPTQALRFENIYLTLKRMMQSWNEEFQKQANAVHRNFFCFYKYSSLEGGIYRDMAQYKNKFEDEYSKFSKEILARKEKLFAAGDITRWDLNLTHLKSIPKEDMFKDKELAFDIMLPHETSELKIKRDMVAYLNYTTFAEVSRALDSRNFLYNNNFQTFEKIFVESVSKLKSTWENAFNIQLETRSRSKAKGYLLSDTKSFILDQPKGSTNTSVNLSKKLNTPIGSYPKCLKG